MADLLYKIEKSRQDVEELLTIHKNLVYYMLGRMQQLSNQDAESAAWEALWDAIETFDVFSKTAFSTYACTNIKNAVNDILRKQQVVHKLYDYSHDYSDMTQFGKNEADTESMQAVKQIYAVYDKYVTTKHGLVRNILTYWYSTNFEGNVNNIAAACRCSPSYVCRVQCDFRAYLASKLSHS